MNLTRKKNFMDDIARHNQQRWEALAQAGIEYSRPILDLTANSARQLVDPYGVMGDVRGKDVLCLASGGGQQSAAFGLLGAHVTVLDFSATQLERDREALTHYGLDARLEQGDMRDLSRFADASFDLIWHAFSISFIPDTSPVFDEVARVLRPGGWYHLAWHNPFVHGLDDREWNGTGYPLKLPYVDGQVQVDPTWDVDGPDGVKRPVEGPHEFRHILSTVINGLIGRGFVLRGLWEDYTGDPTAQPGTWEYYLAVAPLALVLWARYQPE